MLLAELNLTLIIVAAIGAFGTIVTAVVAGLLSRPPEGVKRHREAIPLDVERSAESSGQPADAEDLPRDSGQRNGKSTKSYRRWTTVMFVSMALTLVFGGTLAIAGKNVTGAVQDELQLVLEEAADFKGNANTRIAELESWTRQFERLQAQLVSVVRDTQFKDTEIKEGLEQLRAFQDLLMQQGGPDALVQMQEGINSLLPVGTIVPYAGSVWSQDDLPSGWLLCDGRQVPQESEYDQLRQLLRATAWGNRGAVVHVPDLRGMFLRGVDDPDGPAGKEWKAGDNDKEPDKRVDPASGKPDDRVGSVQDDAFQVHKHQYSNGYVIKEGGGGDNGIRWGEEFKARTDDRAMTSKITKDSPDGPTLRAGNETRPKNAYVNFIIKY